MYRSGSANRVSDDHYSYYASSSPSSKVPTALRSMSQGDDELPVYEPFEEEAKKDKVPTKSGEKAVHLIPLVLFICALILWLSSNSDIDLRSSSVVEDIKGISTEGHLDSDGTGQLPVELVGDMDSGKRGDDPTTYYSQIKNRRS